MVQENITTIYCSQPVKKVDLKIGKEVDKRKIIKEAKMDIKEVQVKSIFKHRQS